jgi:hypothetical protein
MVAQTLQASKINMRVLIKDFHLVEAADEAFFAEWHTDLPTLTDTERVSLDRVKANFFNLLRYPPTLDKAVQVAILMPMLAEAGVSPVHVKAEKSVEITAEDEGAIVRGQIDFLLLREQFWIAAVESRAMAFSVESGIAQLLDCMLAASSHSKPCYGLVTTGGSFVFVKLVHSSPPMYAASDQFDMRKRGNELYQVYAFLKKLGQI